MEGSEMQMTLDPNDDLVIPEVLQSKVEIVCVAFGGARRTVIIRALEGCYVDPEDFLRTEDDYRFDAYRQNLEEFLEYRAELSERFEDLR